MGCGMRKSEPKLKKSIRAALLIQRWYRQYVARLEMRRRCTWNIFQSIEYAGQQDQIKGPEDSTPTSRADTAPRNLISHIFRENEICRDIEWERYFCYKSVEVADSYSGPHLTFPMTFCGVSKLVEAFKHKQLHARYVLQLLGETWRLLRILPNINHVSTCHTKEITICGIKHQALSHLPNGLPSLEKPYVFNGDYVDRGKNSLEILLILFGFLLLYPNDILLNRGNHEDHIVNLRYGFTKEVLGKYRVHGKKILKLLQKIFSWLPLATVIDQKVLVVHGGISDTTDLDVISRLTAANTTSNGCRCSELIRTAVVLQIVDVLWSDPMPQNGCMPNEVRGGGCYWGPDVTQEVLEKHNLQLLIRSHECKQEGYEFCHDRRVLTIFSASNYYDLGSNRGAYIRMGPDLVPHFVQYQASRTGIELSLRQSVGHTERSALRSLRQQLFAHKSDLISAFQEYDSENTGLISQSQWASATEKVLNLGLPWRVLRPQLVSSMKDGMVDYHKWIQELSITEPKLELYLLSTKYAFFKSLSVGLFCFLSGLISLEEFRQTWKLLSSHLKMDISDKAITDLAHSIDFNKDGSIDINEFMEAFRLVDLSAHTE
uniref:Serine/threonine-protein phosphatase n=1 Tax=Sphaeramia orbicularis TaxID=375764 RepID=A0A673B121_9TELE